MPGYAQIMVYSMPLIMWAWNGVNETMDRIMLKWWVPGNNDYKRNTGGYLQCLL